MSQFDLFPERVTVERVDARSRAGERSRVKAIFIVQFERRPGRHQVFHDQHGWYCVEHGQKCPAVDAAKRGQRPEAKGQTDVRPRS
jgi:hypothetical protein